MTQDVQQRLEELERQNAVLTSRLAEMEQHLTERERHLRAILDSEPECVKLVAADGRLLDMNRAGLAMIEADDTNQVFGQCIYSIVAPEHRVAFQGLNEQVFRGESGTLEFEIIGLKGHRRWMETHATPLRADSGEIISALAVTRDITERRLANQALLASEARLRMILEQLPALLWTIDSESRLTSANGAGLVDLGLLPTQVVGKTLQDFLQTDDPSNVVLSAHRKALMGETVEYAVEFSQRVYHSYVEPLRDAHGVIVGVLGLSVDLTERTRNEQTLQKSEARYRLLADHADDMVSVFDPAGNCLYLSPSYHRITGWTPEDVRLTDWRSRLHTDDLPIIENAHASNLAGKSTLIEHRVLCKDGSWIWVELRCSPIQDESGRVTQLLMWSRDVTDRKWAEDALQASEERLRQAMTAARIGTWEVDLTSPDFPVRWADNYGRLFGEEEGEVPKSQEEFFRFVHPDDQNLMRQEFARSLTSNTPYECEFRMVWPDGTIHWHSVRGQPQCDAWGRPLRMFGIDMDVTARKQAEEALRRSQRHLTELINSIDGIVWEADAETFQITFISPQAERLLGYPISNWLEDSQFWANHIVPEDRERVVQLCLDCTRDRRNHEFEYRMVAADGRTVWLRDIVTVVSEDGKPVTLRGLAVDIDQRKRADSALRESERRFRELYESSRDAIFVEGFDGIVLDVNPAACRLHDMSREQLIGKHVRDLVPESSRPQLDLGFQKLLDGQLTQTEGLSLRADGSVVPVELTASQIVFADKPALLLHVRDITDRKKVEVQLRQSEDKFSKVFRNNPNAILLTTFDGRIVDANEGFARLTGHVVEQVRGQTTIQLGFWQNITDRERFVSQLRERGSVQEFEAILKTGSGELRSGVISAEAMEFEGNVVIVSIVRDVTNRRRMEDETMRYQQLLESIRKAQLQFLLDRPTNEVFGEMLNDLLKLTLSEYGFIGEVQYRASGESFLKTHSITNIAWNDEIREWFDTNAQDGLEFSNLQTLFGTVLTTAQPVIANDPSHDSRRGGLPNGHPALRAFLGLPFRFGEKMVGMVGIANRPGGYQQDIVDFLQPILTTCGHLIEAYHGRQRRKQAEQALRESQAMLQLILDSIPQGVFWKDRQSVYVGANRVCRRAMGLAESQSPAGLTDRDIHSLGPEEAEFFVAKDREVMDADQPQLGIEETMTVADGRTIWLETNKLPMHDPDGRVCGILGTWQDITEKKQAAEELSASRERLAALSRQLISAQESERRHLSRELHDEIGQALTGIKLNLKALLQPDGPSRMHSLVNDTLVVVDQTLRQVRDLALDLRPSILDDIGLVPALRWCLDRQSQRAGFAVHFHAEPNELSVAPEVAIVCFRVVQESLTNVARHANARHVHVDLQLSDSELKLSVHDDGCGFDVAAARINALRSESLGLLGMFERVDLVHGKLQIESSANGTTIRATFPVVNQLDRDETDREPVAADAF